VRPEDKGRVVRGEVFFEGRWVPMEQKLEHERARRKKIEAGYVLYQGEWITIDEKLARVTPPAAGQAAAPVNIVINKNDNRTLNYVDNKTVHTHDHRHVHVDAGLLADPSRPLLADGQPAPFKELTDGKSGALPPPDSIRRGLLSPPDDSSQSDT
jgi:hypothetical protein